MILLLNYLFYSLIHRIFLTSCRIHCEWVVVDIFVSNESSAFFTSCWQKGVLSWLILCYGLLFPLIPQYKRMHDKSETHLISHVTLWTIGYAVVLCCFCPSMGNYTVFSKKSARVHWIFLISLFSWKIWESKKLHNVLVPGKTKSLSYIDSIH